ncbi:hypothetical protein REL12_001165 [Clostridioides difficile]|uniref:hypothetical protein n=1 Tax=Clostridioides difficile TaxID=1496 RepID=UPI000B216EA4|nr:hypothetical protein [Clostridioides difficile]MCB4320307.1 hypothetical protein [Clostridioides difficile]MCH7246469.1 hypothetical protein [Clostridioides difficile]MCI4860737.1 hypothetical protein [Clostridioides difficile]MCK3702718.1 hypothetical protein [Clostridioides difficile]MCK3710214.1 hypothetical protein [Clostridioides difficile]
MLSKSTSDHLSPVASHILKPRSNIKRIGISILLPSNFSISNNTSSLFYISFVEYFSLEGSFIKSHEFSCISLNLYASLITELRKLYLTLALVKVELLKL